jgi:hypothetical protein
MRNNEISGKLAAKTSEVSSMSIRKKIGIAVLLFCLVLPGMAAAGNLAGPGTAPSAGSGMPTTADIYNRLDTGADISAPGAFREPTAGPTAGTGRTLTEIKDKLPVPDNTNGANADNVFSGKTFWGLRTDGTWGLKTGTYTPALTKRVNKTGQTKCWNIDGTEIDCTGTGQDGEYQYGIDPAIAPNIGYNTPAFTGTRFIDNVNGSVTDTLNALIWTKNANCFGTPTWADALAQCNSLASGACGLTDGSTAGQWRLPNLNELHSLGPTWPAGSPFINETYHYWASTSAGPSWPNMAWNVYFPTGAIGNSNKDNNHYVRCVRGGQ